MVLLYVNGSNLKSRLESYIKKQENGRMPRSRRIRELQKTFEFNRSDVVSVLRQIRRLEDLEPEFKKVVKPAVQPEEVPDAPQDLEINTERRPGQIDPASNFKSHNKMPCAFPKSKATKYSNGRWRWLRPGGITFGQKVRRD
jgi:hypothetical protein